MYLVLVRLQAIVHVLVAVLMLVTECVQQAELCWWVQAVIAGATVVLLQLLLLACPVAAAALQQVQDAL